MMQQLENVAQIAEVFGADKAVVDRIRQATVTLKESLINAIKDKLYTLPEETVAYPGHGPETQIGYEKQYNPFVGA